MVRNVDALMLLLIFFSIFIVLVIVIYKMTDFLETRKFIKMEISRTTGKEKEYWKKQLRKHYSNFFKW